MSAVMPQIFALHRERREQTYNCPTKMIKNYGLSSGAKPAGSEAARCDLSWIGHA
jgi:hypothetical protein